MAESLIPPPPAMVRNSKDKAKKALLVLMLLGGVGMAYYVYSTRQGAQTIPIREVREIPESDTTGQVPTMGDEQKRIRSYRKQSLLQQPSGADQAAMPAVGRTTAARELTVALPAQPNPFQERPPASMRPQPPRELNGRRQAAALAPPRQLPQPTQPQPANNWLLPKTDQVALGKPPFTLPEDEEEKADKGSKLFPKATQERPKRPERVVYQQQIIQGQLMSEINSDTPGIVLIRGTENVEDRWGQGEVLLPQYTVYVTEPTGKVAQGQERIDIHIRKAELPNGTDIAFAKAIGGDQRGAAGVPGDVDHHYWQKGIAAVLTVMLSVGSRAVAGNPTGYNYSLGQEFARDGSQEINRMGRKWVDELASRPPTIRAYYGAPVTIMLQENINLQSDPVIVSR